MSKRGLRPSEFVKLKELGFTREDADIYAQSGYREVDDWINAKKLNISNPEEFYRFKKSDFENFENFIKAEKAGFEDREEYEQSIGGNFPDRATWLIAKELGILTYKKYKEHLASKKNKIQTKDKDTEEKITVRTSVDSSNTQDSQSQEEKPVTHDSLLARALSTLHAGKTFGDEEVSPSQEPLGELSVPQIEPSEFFENPLLEQMYRFAEVLEQTFVVDIDDFKEALSFSDIYDTEEFLTEYFNLQQYSIDLEKMKITFQKEILQHILRKINELRQH